MIPRTILAGFAVAVGIGAASAPQGAQAQWFGWEDLGGVILEEPDCVSWGQNRIDCFARGTNAAMFHRWWDGSSWGGWESLGGIILEDPECVSWGPNRLDCFARGTDQAMYHRWWNGASWGGWENLGGVILDKPDCVSWGPNRLDCFARGTDRAMYHRWWNGSSWGGWENLGGAILDAPECVSWGPNRIDCFARGTDRAMYHRWWDGSSWAGWENLGGIILEKPECTSWGPNRIDCFARGTDAAMFHRWWDGSSWGGWESLGGIILEEPECTSWGPNRIDCFARGTNAAMFHRWWDGSAWGGWESLGGIVLDKPSCVSWGPNRIDCFARGTNRAMFHRWFTGVVNRAITVRRHVNINLTDAEVDGLLGDGNTVLQTNDGPGDIACGVAIGRSGAVGTFNVGTGVINTQAELTAVFGAPGNVKVVNDVNWCANMFNSSFIGCGQTPGTSFITERFTAGLEGILWTHEFGHNQGLPHRTDTSDAVMFPSIGANRRRANQGECNAFRGSGPALMASVMETLPVAELGMAGGDGPAAPVTLAAQPMPGEATGGEAMPGANTDRAPMPDEMAMDNAAEGAGPLPPVEEFVSQIWIHGLPLDRAAEYGEDAVDTLLAMLRDPANVMFHENIALTLGMIGSSRAVEPLIDYVRGGADAPAIAAGEEEGRRAFKGRVGAMIGLGYLINQTGDEQALEFLKESSEPMAWDASEMEAFAASQASGDPARDLSNYALLSLGLSGNEEAAEFLRSLPASAGAADDAVALEAVEGVREQALMLNEQVAQAGIIEYYQRNQ